jgi:hypothetical protein
MIRLHSIQRLIVSLVLVTVPVLAASAPALAYPRATVFNHTNVAVSGTVHYAACRPDRFTIPPGHQTASGAVTPTSTTMSAARGACLITKVDAVAGGVPAIPFTSSGTARDGFVVVRTPQGFAVHPG